MITRIIKHDLRGLAADKTLLIVSVLFTLLIAYGVYNGATWLDRRQSLICEAEKTAAETLNTQRRQVLDIETGRKTMTDLPTAGRPSSLQALAVMPPTHLSALSVGLSDLLPYSTEIGIYSTKDMLVKQSETDNPINLLSGRFDLAFVLIYLYPLLILAISYNLLSQERESGTLQMTLAQAPLRLRTFALGKVMGRAGVVLLLSIVVSLVGVLLSGDLSGDFGSSGLTAEDAAGVRLLLWMAAVIGYTFFWFAVAVAVNALGHGSATNATALVGIWLLLVVIFPALLNVAATSIHPLPSRLEFITRMREADNEANREAKNILARYVTDHPELAPGGAAPNLDDFSIRYYAQKQETERRALIEAAAFDEQLARQQRIINRYRFLSPAIVMQETLNDIAGTSRERHERFARQVRDFMDRWRGRYVPLVFRTVNLQSTDYDAVPRFQFGEEPTVRVVQRVVIGLLGLIVPALVIGFLALRALKRYPLVG